MARHRNGSTAKIDPDFITRFRERLLAWFDRARRDLPWRRNPTPYAVAVSEFMLQQTQVSTVLPYFEHWMRRFPDWAALASAEESTVLKAWEGLGYYRRARLLHALARRVVALPGGELPPEPAALLQLPGIGPYTAGAIASIAFQQPAPAVDGNVERVLARVFHEKGDLARPATRRRLSARAAALVRNERPGDYTQALMELGALVCSPREPHCVLCPIRAECARPDPARIPRRTRVRATREEETLAWITSGPVVFLRPPGPSPRWPDFWKLPIWDDANMAPVPVPQPVRLSYGITRFRVAATLKAGHFFGPVPDGLEAVEMAALPEILLPTPHRRLVIRLLGGQAGAEDGSLANAAKD